MINMNPIYICDICGQPADGNFSSTSYLNDELYGEYSCGLDLCKFHMKQWAESFVDTAIERYEKEMKPTAKANLIQVMQMKDYWENEND